jgi:hypothetical protein
MASMKACISGRGWDVLEVFKVVVVFIFDLLDPESAL